MQSIGKMIDKNNITKEKILKIRDDYISFTKLFPQLKVLFEGENGKEEVERILPDVFKKHRDNYAICVDIVDYGDALMGQGKLEVGIRCLQIARDFWGSYVNDVTYYLRSAEYYLELGETELGISFLIKLCCETSTNFEEIIEICELTPVWKKYKHLVEGKVPASLFDKPLAPEECSMQIEDILQLQEDELLSELSMHLYELSRNGESLNYLNRWERLVFYLDSLCTDINSDGIEHFVDYNRKRLKPTRKAMDELKIEHGVILLDRIQEKMKKHVEDFEAEESFYYEFIERELLEKLYQYVIDNKERFR